MSASIHRASRFDVREHIRRAALLHVLFDFFGLVLGPLVWLIPDHLDSRMWIIKVGFGIVLPLRALWDSIGHIRYLRDPFDHPALQWKRHAAPGALIAELEREMGDTRQHVTIGKVVLTPHWMVRANLFVLTAVPYSQLAWVYEKSTNQYTLSSLASDGKRFALSLHTRNGKTQALRQFTEPQTVELLQQIVVRAPWAIVGFDVRTDIAWTLNRAEFLRMIEDRAARVRAGAAAATPDPI